MHKFKYLVPGAGVEPAHRAAVVDRVREISGVSLSWSSRGAGAMVLHMEIHTQKYRYMWLFFICLMGPAGSQAASVIEASGVVRGLVLDERGFPIPGATVSLSAGDTLIEKVSVDGTGWYRFSVDLGESRICTAEASGEGFISEKKQLEVRPGVSTGVDFFLMRTPVSGDPATVMIQYSPGELEGEVTDQSGAVLHEGDSSSWLVMDLSPVTIVPDRRAGRAPLELSLTAENANRSIGITSYRWDLDGDGSEDSREKAPTHVYRDPGLYTVRLLTTDTLEREFTSTFDDPEEDGLEGSEGYDIKDVAIFDEDGYLYIAARYHGSVRSR